VAGNDSIERPIVPKRLKNIWPVAGVIAGLLIACILGLSVVAFLIGQMNQGNGEIIDNDGSVLSGTAGLGEGTLPTTGDSTGDGQGLGEEVAATVTLPGGGGANNSLVLFYNTAGFYAWNSGNQDINVRQIIFEAIDNTGQPAGFQFEGRRWAGFYPEIQTGKCDRLEIIGASPIERPQQCHSYNALLTPESFDTMIFWLARDNISQFRVLFGGQEVGRCEIAAGQCEVSLP
jgi:hypothetical protein